MLFLLALAHFFALTDEQTAELCLSHMLCLDANVFKEVRFDELRLTFSCKLCGRCTNADCPKHIDIAWRTHSSAVQLCIHTNEPVCLDKNYRLHFRRIGSVDKIDAIERPVVCFLQERYDPDLYCLQKKVHVTVTDIPLEIPVKLNLRQATRVSTVQFSSYYEVNCTATHSYSHTKGKTNVTWLQGNSSVDEAFPNEAELTGKPFQILGDSFTTLYVPRASKENSSFKCVVCVRTYKKCKVQSIHIEKASVEETTTPTLITTFRPNATSASVHRHLQLEGKVSIEGEERDVSEVPDQRSDSAVPKGFFLPPVLLGKPTASAPGKAQNNSVTLKLVLSLSLFGAFTVAATVALVLWLRGKRAERWLKMSNGNWKRSWIELGSEIGRGYFGVVVEGLVVAGPAAASRVAVKMAADAEEQTQKCIEAEAGILMLAGEHTNVNSLLGVVRNKGALWLIFARAPHGDLRSHLKLQRVSTSLTSKNPNEKLYRNEMVLECKKLYDYVLQVAQGMEHLASKKIVHRDLAARNVLVFRQGKLKISDFGLAKDVSYCEYYRRKTPGLVPFKWSAPEVLVDRLYTEYSDVWSFGILIWEIATFGGTPYPGVPLEKLYSLLTETKYRMSCPKGCPKEMYQIVLQCWGKVPSKRPNFEFLVIQLTTMLEKELQNANLFIFRTTDSTNRVFAKETKCRSEDVEHFGIES